MSGLFKNKKEAADLFYSTKFYKIFRFSLRFMIYYCCIIKSISFYVQEACAD